MNRSKLLRVFSFILTLVFVLLAATAALAYSTIPYGTKSDAVRRMQSALYDEGFYNGEPDGKFGPATKRAVEAFQRYVGLNSDGKPGNKTLTALYDDVWYSDSSSNSGKYNTKTKDSRSLYYGCTGSRVSDLQQALYDDGYYNGSIDGRYGDSTYTAVQRFQRAHNLTADGIAGVKTLAKLGLSTSSSGSSSSSSGSMILALGSRGSEVSRLQQYLRDKGYSISDSSGVFGDGTRQALIAWQGSRGFATTGALTESDYNRYVK